MPNWCMNQLLLTGPKDVLTEIAETGLSLAKLVPVPDELQSMQKIYPVPKSEVKARAALRKKYGVDTAFDWQVKNWGTKWDFGPLKDLEADPVKMGRKITHYEINASFDTAWGPPVEAMKAVHDRYKDRGLNIWMEYFEPGVKFLGTVTTKDGIFLDECYEYQGADDLEDYVRKLDHGMAESEIECLREQEAEEAAEKAAEEAKKAAAKPAKKAAAPKKTAAKPAKKATKKPAKKLAAKKVKTAVERNIE